MTIDAGLIRIAVIFLPGVVTRIILQSTRASKTRTIWEDLLDILLYAFVCYALTGILFFLLRSHKEIVPNNFAAIINSKEIDWLELLVAGGFSVLVGPAASFIDNHKLINKLARLMGITKSFGDADVWDFVQNSDDIDWVTIRDFTRSLTYTGHIKAFSDAYKQRELLLTTAKIYSSEDGSQIDSLDALYLSFKDNDIVIEVPKLITSIPSELSALEMKKVLRNARDRKTVKAFEMSYRLNKKTNSYFSVDEVKLKAAILIQTACSNDKQARR